jgi:hypothetical protein
MKVNVMYLFNALQIKNIDYVVEFIVVVFSSVFPRISQHIYTSVVIVVYILADTRCVHVCILKLDLCLKHL